MTYNNFPINLMFEYFFIFGRIPLNFPQKDLMTLQVPFSHVRQKMIFCTFIFPRFLSNNNFDLAIVFHVTGNVTDC